MPVLHRWQQTGHHPSLDNRDWQSIDNAHFLVGWRYRFRKAPWKMGWRSACGRHRCMNDREARTTRFRRRETPPDDPSDPPNDLWHDLALARDAFDRGVSPTGVDAIRGRAETRGDAAGAPRRPLTGPERSRADAITSTTSIRRQRDTAVDRDTGRSGDRTDAPPASVASRSSWTARGGRNRGTEPPVTMPFSRRDEWLASSGHWATVPPGGVARVRPSPARLRWPRIAAMIAGVVVGWQVLTGLAMPAPPLPPQQSATQVAGQSDASGQDTAVTWVTPTSMPTSVEASGDGRVPDVAPEPALDVPASPTAVVRPTNAPVAPTRVPIVPTRVPPTATRVPPTRVPSTPTAVPPSRTPNPAIRPREMTVTAYCLRSNTSSGAPPTPGTAAAGPMVPIGSRFSVPGYGEVVVRDRNANYGPNQLDVWLADCNQAIRWGRRTLEVTPEQ